MTNNTLIAIFALTGFILLCGCMGSNGTSATPTPVATIVATPVQGAQPTQIAAQPTAQGALADSEIAALNSSQPTADQTLVVGNESQDASLPSADVPSYG